MKNFFLFVAFMAYLGFSSGCNKEILKGTKSSGANAGTTKVSENISPGHCRITGTIVRIDSTLDSGNKNNPCSKVPCTAVVKVDSVWGYGLGFPPLGIGKEITIKFKFTLGPTTKELFPGMKDFYPGLKIGDSFLGDIQKELESGTAGKGNFFTIYGYRKNN